MAWFFGTSLAKSAFDVAFRLPNLLRRLFGEGALFAAFVPVFTETLDREGKEEASRLLSRAMTLVTIALSIVVLAGMVAAGLWMQIGSPGERAAAVLPLLRIMLPYSVLICLAALFMAALNSMGHFAAPAAAPMVLNGGIIIALVFLCPLFGSTTGERVFGVAWGVLICGVVQMGMLVPVLRRCGMKLRFDLKCADRRVRDVLLLMGPAALGMGVVQINVFIDGVLAMIVGPWAPAALTYAERLIYLPLGVFATALGTVLLPTFSRQLALARVDEVHRTMSLAIRRLMLIMAPASVGLCILADPIVKLVYVWKHGRFDDLSSAYASRALAFYAPGLVVFSLYKVLVPVFYAQKDTGTPTRVGMWAVLFNLVMNLVAVFTWPAGYEHAGMALATVLASALNCLVLAVLLHRRMGDPGWGRMLRSTWGILASCCVMALCVWGCIRILPPAALRLGLGLKAGHLLGAGGSILAGAVSYTLAVLVFCREDLAEVASFVRRRRG
jgi:putative peptidoglycan lipid II flippase